jgi:hypothetical protein
MLANIVNATSWDLIVRQYDNQGPRLRAIRMDAGVIRKVNATVVPVICAASNHQNGLSFWPPNPLASQLESFVSL